MINIISVAGTFRGAGPKTETTNVPAVEMQVNFLSFLKQSWVSPKVPVVQKVRYMLVFFSESFT